MRVLRLLVGFVLAVASASAVAESTNPIVLPPSDERLIRELEAESWSAWQNHDAAFFERFLSDDHVDVHANGIVGKSAIVDVVRVSSASCKAMHSAHFHLRPYRRTRCS